MEFSDARYKSLTARKERIKTGIMTTRQDRIRETLAQALQPIVLSVVNKSMQHRGHAGDDGSGESHFHVEVVSERFTGLSRIERQRMLNDLLDMEFKGGLHALSLRLLSPDEEKK